MNVSDWKFDGRSWLVAATATLLVAAFSVGCALGYQRLFDQRQAEKRDEAARLLLSFEANSTRLFDYADSYLKAVRAYRADHRDEQWERFVDEIKAPHADLFAGVLTVFDRDGRVAYQSSLPKTYVRSLGSMADLDHYQYFASHPGDSLFIGATRQGRLTGRLQFRCARPLLRNGAFDGVVVLTLLPEHLTDFYRTMSLGPHSTITMMTLEPKLIARQPPPSTPALYGRLIPGLKETFGIDLVHDTEGKVFGIGSPFESGSRRDVFYKRLADYPIVVMVGLDSRDIAADMTGTRNALTGLAVVFAAGVLAVCAMLLGMLGQNRRLKQLLAANQRAEEELRVAAAAFESQESMVITDANGVVIRVNQAFTETTGFAAEDIVGRTPRMLKSNRHDAAFYRAMWDCINRSGSWQGEIWDKRKDGADYPKWLTISAVKDKRGAVTHYVGTHFDISERKKAEERIQDLAFYDQLTGLPNRTLLLDRLKQAMAAGVRDGRFGALLFIDLDNFKALNDTLGHDNGDLLLQQVAKRLLACVREGDTSARFGGDEFVVMLKALSAKIDEAAAQAEAVGEKILAALNRNYLLGSREYRCTPSIGVTLFGKPGVSREELLKQADLAMYQAKAAGRNVLRFFDPGMQATVSARVALEHDLRDALREEQFVLYYQPQIDAGGRCTGAEVLLRWRHPERGLVPPDAFIPLAEETGLILPIGQWVLRSACAQLAAWEARAGFRHMTLAVNVSGRQLHQKNFVEEVLAALADTGADPRKLKLELTESQLLAETEDTIAKMNALKARGVSFALDDFGTGYSSLAYLKRLPLEKLKIDYSFVRDVLVDPNDAAIVMTIVGLAQTLGLGVIAEGVETDAQREFLARHGCSQYQGYLFSRPLPLAEFAQFFEARLQSSLVPTS